MAVVINTNVDSIRIQNFLDRTTSNLSSTMQRMSTGLKINSAKDDAAGSAISARMKVQLSGNQTAQNNVQGASAMLSTAEGNLDVIADNLSRIRDLTLQAKNGTYSESEKKAMQDEVGQRIDEIERVSGSSKYSQLSLFSNDADSLGATGVTFQVGADKETNNTIQVTNDVFKDACFSTLTTMTTAVHGEDVAKYDDTNKFDISDGSFDFEKALKQLDAAIDNVSSRKSLIGSAQNRLASALSTLTTQYENLSSANSIIADANIASEASNFTQSQILQQVSTSLLAQANQAPGIALSLI